MTVPGGIVASLVAAAADASDGGAEAPFAADELPLKNRIEAIIRKTDNTFRNSFRVDPLRKKSDEKSQRSAQYQVTE